MPTSRSAPFCPLRWLLIAGAACLLLMLNSALVFAQTGTVSGTVTDSGSGAPVAGLGVFVVTVQGSEAGAGITNASGVYTITVPIGALYYVRTGFTNGYIPEAFPDVQCPIGTCTSAELRESEPFSITSGGAVTGRNFAVVRGGTISGTVTNAAGTGVANVSVTAVTRLGTQTFTYVGSTNASGNYTIFALPQSTYFLYTSNNQGLRNEYYDDIPCLVFCFSTNALTVGTPVPVSLGATTAGRNFSLETGGSITGVVTNAATGQPLQNVSVTVAARVSGTVLSVRLRRPTPTANTPSAVWPRAATRSTRAPTPRPMRSTRISSASTSATRPRPLTAVASST